MAQGDIIVSIADLASHTLYVVQPPSGASWLVDDFFAAGDGTLQGYGQYYDGVDGGGKFFVSLTDGDFISYRAAQSKTHQETMFHITNSLYWQVYNESAGTKKCGVVALQLK